MPQSMMSEHEIIAALAVVSYEEHDLCRPRLRKLPQKKNCARELVELDVLVVSYIILCIFKL